MSQQMEFPETFEKFAKEYGFKDDKKIYTNGSDLISVFRVKQWLEHISITKNNLSVNCDELNLEQGKAVAFDFDGVIHKYSEGWKDGSIYDKPNMEILDLILSLQLANIPCVIISTREPNQIKEWWDKQGFTIMAKPLCFETKFFNDCTYVGITNRKIPAQLYIDDRAYRYTGQTAKEFLIDQKKSK